jgi:hypothetical protein
MKPDLMTGAPLRARRCGESERVRWQSAARRGLPALPLEFIFFISRGKLLILGGIKN